VIRKRIAALAVLGLALAVARAHAQPAPDPADKPDQADKADKADKTPPSAADLEKAKKAFAEGKRLFDAKQYAEAVEKFKESYRLSKNPLLLYNVGVTFDQKGDRDMALFYYKKFLADAPAKADQRAEVAARVKELEQQKPEATPPEPTAPTTTQPTPDTSATPDASAPETSEPSAPPHPKHPKGQAYAATDFEHQIVDSAPPGQPLDLTAYAPEDAGWQVTLFYRGAGDDKFTMVPMRPRYHELVARIPGKRMTGASVQYYIEVKDKDGAIVTRIGRASSPNLVYLEDGAKPRFYPDMPDDDGTAAAALREQAPAHAGDEHAAEAPAGDGLFDAGSRSFERAKWGATYTAGGLVVVSLVFYWVASDAASTLEGDAARSQSDCGTPPCSTYDADLKTIESRGRGFQTMSNVALGLGLVSAAAAGYFWYEEYAHHGRERAASRGGSRSVVAMPVVGQGFVGGAAALSF
jgi:hypothetical protein